MGSFEVELEGFTALIYQNYPNLWSLFRMKVMEDTSRKIYKKKFKKKFLTNYKIYLLKVEDNFEEKNRSRVTL